MVHCRSTGCPRSTISSSEKPTAMPMQSRKPSTVMVGKSRDMRRSSAGAGARILAPCRAMPAVLLGLAWMRGRKTASNATDARAESAENQGAAHARVVPRWPRPPPFPALVREERHCACRAGHPAPLGR
ncbi:hypothetical protein G6F58_013143 [Rhizopus delemar]|nr:hypothetical protein G6F58_013143 [Rhizopus delemar]